MEKKLKSKASAAYRPSKKNKYTLQEFKANMVKAKSKYKILLPKYKPILKEIRDK